MFLRVNNDRVEVVARLVEVAQPFDKPCRGTQTKIKNRQEVNYNTVFMQIKRKI